MAVVRIQDLAAAPVALTGTEPVEIEQGGVSYKTTTQAIADLGAGIANPMTTAGDIITGGSSGTPQRLAVGTNGQVLTVVSGAPAWAAASGGGGGIESLAEKFFIAGHASTSGTLQFIMGSGTNTGTGTYVAPTDTNLLTRQPRTRIAGSNGGVSIGGHRGDSNWFNTTGGFSFVCYFSIDNSTMTSTQRAFVGVRTTVAPSLVDPSSIINMAGFGYDAADSQWQFMSNDGTGTATKTALGASFPKPTVANEALWKATFTVSAAAIDWQLENLTTSAVASGTRSTDLPVSSQFLTFHGYSGNDGTTSATAGLVLSRYEITAS